jgi:predicted membrane metal-binding protein
MATNESAASHRRVVRGSDRSFGLVFAVVFALIALFPLWWGGPVRIWALVVAGAFTAAALLAPAVLRPLSLLWFRIGLLLHRVVNPLLMAVLYFGVFTPMGLVLRARGKDLLNLRRDPDRASYWIAREPPAPKPGSMSKQF